MNFESIVMRRIPRRTGIAVMNRIFAEELNNELGGAR